MFNFFKSVVAPWRSLLYAETSFFFNMVDVHTKLVPIFVRCMSLFSLKNEDGLTGDFLLRTMSYVFTSTEVNLNMESDLELAFPMLSFSSEQRGDWLKTFELTVLTSCGLKKISNFYNFQFSRIGNVGVLMFDSLRVACEFVGRQLASSLGDPGLIYVCWRCTFRLVFIIICFHSVPESSTCVNSEVSVRLVSVVDDTYDQRWWRSNGVPIRFIV